MDKLDELLGTLDKEDVDAIVNKALSDSTLDLEKTDTRSAFVYNKRVGINDLVPEEYQQKLMQIDFTLTQCFWLIGDITNDLIHGVNRQRVKEMGRAVSQQDIFEAVGFFCHRSGRSVKYYYECASFFPPEVRLRYDTSFSIYAIARWSEDWELVLRLATENPYWTTMRVESEYHRLKQDLPDVPVLTSPASPTQAGHSGEPWQENQTEGSHLPPSETQVDSPRGYRSTLLANLDHTIIGLRGVLDHIPLPTGIRVRIGDMILEVEDIMLQVRREM